MDWLAFAKSSGLQGAVGLLLGVALIAFFRLDERGATYLALLLGVILSIIGFAIVGKLKRRQVSEPKAEQSSPATKPKADSEN